MLLAFTYILFALSKHKTFKNKQDQLKQQQLKKTKPLNLAFVFPIKICYSPFIIIEITWMSTGEEDFQTRD